MNNAPRYPIPQLCFPNVSYCELFGQFPPEECQKILDLGDMLKFDAGRVGSNVMVKETRDSSIAWIDHNPEAPALDVRQWMLDKMAYLIGMVNRDKFQLDIDYFHPMQYTTYNLNQHYNWHVDNDEGKEDPEQRKLSAVLMVTGPEEYEGGELELNIGGNPDEGATVLLKPPAGTLVVFKSHIPHRVRPVTKGKRTSIVVWAMGPKLR